MRTVLKRCKTTLSRTIGVERRKTLRNPTESINLYAGVVFIAIPKTGSSSIRRYVRGKPDYLIPQEHLNFRETRDALTAWLIRTRLGANWDFPTQSTPSYEDILSERDALLRSMIKFSVVRNPWARVASLYFRREGVKMSDKLSFDAFVDTLSCASDTCVHPSRHRNQIEWLTDESGALGVDFVEKIEELDNRIPQINEQLCGSIELGRKKMNVNPRSSGISYREIYSSQSRRRVHMLFEKDIDHFQYAF